MAQEEEDGGGQQWLHVCAVNPLSSGCVIKKPARGGGADNSTHTHDQYYDGWYTEGVVVA